MDSIEDKILHWSLAKDPDSDEEGPRARPVDDGEGGDEDDEKDAHALLADLDDPRIVADRRRVGGLGSNLEARMDAEVARREEALFRQRLRDSSRPKGTKTAGAKGVLLDAADAARDAAAARDRASLQRQWELERRSAPVASDAGAYRWETLQAHQLESLRSHDATDFAAGHECPDSGSAEETRGGDGSGDGAEEEDDDDDFLRAYRAKRLAEMTAATSSTASRPEVPWIESREAYLDQVDSADPEKFVVVVLEEPVRDRGSDEGSCGRKTGSQDSRTDTPTRLAVPPSE